MNILEETLRIIAMRQSFAANIQWNILRIAYEFTLLSHLLQMTTHKNLSVKLRYYSHFWQLFRQFPKISS